MKKHIIYWLALGLVIMIGCQKELSFEVGNSPSHGSLQSDASGDCLPKTVNGIYLAGTPLVPATNTITVQLNVAQTGAYEIATDTVNGYYFRTTGTFTALGANAVTLRSNGTPFAAGINNFVISYDTTICDIAVTVLPAGTGAAVFTLNGAPAACTGAVVSGTYATGTALNATNTATINVNVTTIGTYTITTTFQGMTFAQSGAFTTTGANTVVLTGSGLPTTGGANTVPITVGTSTCSFVVNVGSPAVGTLVCASIAVAGTYTANTLVTIANTLQVQINVTTPGAFIISSNTIDGFSFAGSGTAVAGLQIITIIATGTPNLSGTKNFTLTFGSSTCPFTVNVLPASGGAAVGTLAGSPNACTPATTTVNGSYYVGTALTAANTVQIQLNVTTAGTYNISTTTVTGFSFSGSGSVATGNQNVILTATGSPPTTQGPQTFTVTFGTSTCTFTVNVGAALSTDYFPRTTNSNWSYEINDLTTDSLFRYVTAGIHNALGNMYNIFFQDDGTGPDSSGYYRRLAPPGGDYFEWFDFGTFIGYDNPSWGEYIMLKDNVPATTNWKTPVAGFSGTVSGTPATIRFSMTILQKDVPITIISSTGSVTYQNVIVLDEKFELEVAPGVWQDITSNVGSGKSYYARGIGLIKFELFNSAGAPAGHQELRRSQIF